MIKRVLKLLGIVTILAAGILLAPATSANALVLSVNNADLHFTDDYNRTYTPVSDTAAILILNPPVIIMAKDIRNLRTGETSTDVVTAIRGDTIEFILNISNSGDTNAINVVEYDSIPLGTVYIEGSAFDTGSLDPLAPPDTVSFQHFAGGVFDLSDTGTVTAIKWQWDSIEGVSGNNMRTIKFKVRIPR